jgi:hypothetical protein
MGDIEEIIGINKDTSDQKQSNKTSIMTTSNKSSQKRKHDDDYMHGDVEKEAKKLATEKYLSDKADVTITLSND